MIVSETFSGRKEWYKKVYALIVTHLFEKHNFQTLILCSPYYLLSQLLSPPANFPIALAHTLCSSARTWQVHSKYFNAPVLYINEHSKPTGVNSSVEKFRSSCPKVFCEKTCDNFLIIHRKTPMMVSYFSKVAFLWIFRQFSEQLFYRTPVHNCFLKLYVIYLFLFLYSKICWYFNTFSFSFSNKVFSFFYSKP